jgi:CBS domain-containing protein
MRHPACQAAYRVGLERTRTKPKLICWLKTQRQETVPAKGFGIQGRRPMTVRAILDSKGHHIVSVEPDAKLLAAVKLLAERRIGAVLVMSQQRIEGILSERDVVRVLGEQGAGALDEPVDAVMTRKVISCRPRDSVGEIMETMTSGKFRHMPVLDDNRIVGLISIGDIVKWRVREFEHEQQALQDYIKSA